MAFRSSGSEHLPHKQVSDSAHPARICNHGLVEHASRTCHCWTCKGEPAPQDALHSAKLSHRVPVTDEVGQKCKKIRLAPQARGLDHVRSNQRLH